MLSLSFNNMRYDSFLLRSPFLYKTFKRYFSLNSINENINKVKDNQIKQLFSDQNIQNTNNLNTQLDNMAFSLNISNAALEKLKQIKINRKKPDIYLRITVEGGGCSGFVYNLSLENDKSKIIEKDDLLLDLSEIINENIEKIKKDVVNPYLIFVYNPNLKEVRTQYIKTN